jgi:Carboxylesterase type B
MLDVFAPAEGKNHPVVIYIHGGGWHSGDKAEVHNKPKALTTGASSWLRSTTAYGRRRGRRVFLGP